MSFQHPFRRPCPDALHCRKQADGAHMSSFSHVCPYGSRCTNKSTEHQSSWIHVLYHDCPHGDDCSAIKRPGVATEVHLSTFSHPDLLDIRSLCKYGAACHDIHNLEHAKKFVHPPFPKIPPSKIYGHNVIVAMYGDGATSRRTAFFNNRLQLQRRLKEWFVHHGSEPTLRVIQLVSEWMLNFRVVHRCNVEIFTKMWQTGSLMSLHCLQTQAGDFKSILELAVQHQFIHKMESKYPSHIVWLHRLVEQVAHLVFVQRDPAYVADAVPPTPSPSIVAGGAMPSATAKGGPQALVRQIEGEIKRTRSVLSKHADADEV